MKTTRILIVEDESVIAFDLEMQLTNLGYQVVEVVASGESAIVQAGLLRPDIILMDINLEGNLDGIDAARQIREHYQIPVVFLTAYAEDSTLQRAEASRPYGYLVKPCEEREMHATLQMALVRRAAETEVELSEERLRLALDAGEIGSWECDPESGRIVTGGQFYCVLEQPADKGDERLETFLDRVHPEDRAAMDKALSEVVTRETQVHRLFRYPRDDGRTAWVEVHAKSHVGRTGKVTRVIGVVRDITAQQENEEQLRTAAEVFDVTGEGIFITDETNRIIVVNPAFQSITGYSDPEILGADVNDLLFEEPLSSDFYSRINSIPGGQWQGELLCKHKSGQQFPVWATISAVRDMSGAVLRYVVALSDITALRQAEERLVQLAYHDSLTGLPNRQLFNDRLEHALARARRDSLTSALMFIDLDGFKDVNDKLGHAAGDRVLRDIAERIGHTVRAADTAARFGGDEFLVLLDSVHQYEDAVQVAQKVLEALAVPLTVANATISLSASIGIALYPADARDPHSLLKAADAALYRAKSQGRNRFCFHTD